MSNQITIEELRKRFPGASESTLRRNMNWFAEELKSSCGYCEYDEAEGHLLKQCSKCKAADNKVLAAKESGPRTAPASRIRQDKKPLMNKLEQDWFRILQRRHPGVSIRPQAKRYKLCSGAWYKPDMTAVLDGVETAWECKGPSVVKGVSKGLLALKFAAHEWPEVRFWLVWRSDGEWRAQRIFGEKSCDNLT